MAYDSVAAIALLGEVLWGASHDPKALNCDAHANIESAARALPAISAMAVIGQPDFTRVFVPNAFT